MNRSKVKPAVNNFLDGIGQPLSLVDLHTYLGVTIISSDLRWQNHTSNISAKASRILNFVRRMSMDALLCESNCLHHLSKTSSGILISSMGPTWTYTNLNARFVMNDYRRTTSVTSLLNQLVVTSVSSPKK